MKNLFLSLLAIVLVSTASAQKGGAEKSRTAEEKANKQADRLKTELNLSDDQRAKTYEACLTRAKKVQEIKTKYKDSANKKGMRAEVKSAQTDFRNTLSTFLTAEQMAKYDDLQKKRKEKAQGRKKGGKGKPAEDSADDDE